MHFILTRVIILVLTSYRIVADWDENKDKSDDGSISYYNATSVKSEDKSAIEWTLRGNDSDENNFFQ